MSTVKIFVNSINTILPFDGTTPDYSDIPDYALVSLQSAFGSGDYEIVPDIEPLPETLQPNWQRFYDGLIVSNIYNYLLTNTIPHPSISGVMAIMGFSIKFGIDDPGNPDRLDALQASVSAALYAINAVELLLTENMLSEIRSLLDDNGFQSISLG